MSNNVVKKTEKGSRWNTNKVISYAAFFISVISLVALLYQSYLAREENRLMQKQQSATVIPYLNQWFDDSPGKHEMVLGNDGVGPALIKTVEITLKDGKKFNNTDILFPYLKSKYKHLDSINYLYSTLATGSFIPANKTIDIISFDNSLDFQTFKQVLDEEGFYYEIIYEDIYGSSWKLSYLQDVPEKISE